MSLDYNYKSLLTTSALTNYICTDICWINTTDSLMAVSKGSVPLFSNGHAIHLVTAALAMSLNNYITDLMQLYEPHTNTAAPHEGTCYLYKVNLQSELQTTF